MKLKLPTVTLLIMDTACHQLSRMAIDDCLSKADFAEVVVFSDQNQWFTGLEGNSSFHEIAPYKNKYECGYSLWHDAPPAISTQHVLIVQWDAWITDPSAWTDEFLQYDYIGALWPYADEMVIGNGGFSLRSKRLMDHVSQNLDVYAPPKDRGEDHDLCRIYRRMLERNDFKWAPRALASRFSFEDRDLRAPSHFGYHGIFNWPLILEGDALQERLKLAWGNEYIKNSGMIRVN